MGAAGGFSSPIAARRMQPFKFWHQFRGQLNALRINAETALIDLASAGDYVQIAAGRLGIKDSAVIIFNLFKTAEAALVTF